jgi:hypothetical protein
VNMLYDKSIAIIVAGTHFGKESMRLLDRSKAVSELSRLMRVSTASEFKFLNRNVAYKMNTNVIDFCRELKGGNMMDTPPKVWSRYHQQQRP